MSAECWDPPPTTAVASCGVDGTSNEVKLFSARCHCIHVYLDLYQYMYVHKYVYKYVYEYVYLYYYV